MLGLPGRQPAHRLCCAMLALRSRSIQSTFVFNNISVVRFQFVEKATRVRRLARKAGLGRAVVWPMAHGPLGLKEKKRGAFAERSEHEEIWV